MIIPELKDDAFLADVRQAMAPGGSYNLWWLGQSGFLLQWRGRHVLLDPYLSDSLTKKYADTDKPHIRMTGRIVDPARLDFIDIVTSSHNHTDHLDAETLVPLLRASPNARLVIPEANRAFVAARLRVPDEFPIGLDAGERIEVFGVTISAVPAAHETVARDAQGRCRYLGYVLQFGGHTIYHSGDTLWDDAIVHALRPFAIDIAILPINGRAPERRVAGNLNAIEAVQLAKSIGARCAIPCHYEMFTFNTADPAAFTGAARQTGQPCRVLRCGERWNSRELDA